MPLEKKLLTVDVGNTATSFGVFSLSSFHKQPHPLHVSTILTSSLRHARAGGHPGLKHVFKNDGFQGIIISSVVPKVERPLAVTLKKKTGLSPIFVTGKTKSKVIIRYHHPSEVGADRIVNARAVIEIHRGASIVVDFGTATTFDCVTARGEYLGGVIAPGPVISAEALYERTAKLPRVLLEKPTRILGRTTLESIQSGLYHGYRGLVREIAGHLQQKMGPGTAIYSTGGQAHWILKGLGIIDENIPSLTLMGLYHVWHDLERRKS